MAICAKLRNAGMVKVRNVYDPMANIELSHKGMDLLEVFYNKPNMRRDRFMAWTDDDAFGGMWDFGEYVVTDLTSFPIRGMIRRDAERAGIDLSNPRRTVASFAGSTFMSTVLGSFLGPVGAIIGGIMGYAVAMDARYEGDRTREERDEEDEAVYALKMKAFATAIEATKEHVSSDTWDDICDAANATLEGLQGNFAEPKSLRRGFDLVFDAVSDSIRDVNSDVYWNFMEVYRAARCEVGV